MIRLITLIRSFTAITTRRDKNIREAEIKMVLASLAVSNGNKRPLALEIGCGKAFQSRILEGRFELVAIDLVKNDYNRKLQCFVLASGSYLPFRQGVFSLVYSSNVLEHIGEREAYLDETKRVLQDEGTVVTVVPTHFWKCLELLLAPIRWFIDATVALANKSNIKKLLGFNFLIHGIYPSNRTELLSYKTKKWVRLHEKSGFEIVRVRNLMAYLPLEFPVPLEFMLNHVSACAVMIVGKARYEHAGFLRS